MGARGIIILSVQIVTLCFYHHKPNHVLKVLLQELFQLKLMYFGFNHIGWPETFITYLSYNSAAIRFVEKTLLIVVLLRTFH